MYNLACWGTFLIEMGLSLRTYITDYGFFLETKLVFMRHDGIS